MGFYYSGALDWSFNEVPITDAVSFLLNGPTRREYVEYVNYHFRELIDKYEPAILWNDIGYPPGTNVNKLFAYFYNKTPDGLVNDRWLQFPRKIRGIVKSWPVRNIIEFIAGIVIRKQGIEQKKPPHSDYATPEYTSRENISERKWESVRGIGNSFGYNRMETESEYLDADEAVRMLVDIVSKNGNLLLNIGPMADGTIPDGQLECIRGIGDWLEINGDAIYGTRPWIRAVGTTQNDTDIRFTRKGDILYAILLDTPEESEIVINNLRAAEKSTVTLLGNDSELEWSRQGVNLKISLPDNLPKSPVHALMITPLPCRD